MTLFLKIMLISHVFLGVLGAIASYAVWIGLTKREPKVTSLQRLALTSALLYLVSWLTAGYYYVNYYGPKVKKIVLAGRHAWAHTVMLEAKEHVFLFLPFLALALWFVLLAGGASVTTDVKFKRSVLTLAGVTMLLGVMVTLAGIFVSGATK